jgi:rhamnogalacturonan acetylesterase
VLDREGQEMKLNVTTALLLVILSVPAVAVCQGQNGPAVPTLFIIGDSTVHNTSGDLVGWGDVIGVAFDPGKIRVENRARGGRSSRTFYTEGLWDQVLTQVKPGDFVLMQFGHNDGGAINDDSRARGSLKGIGEETQEIDNLLTKKHEVVHTFGWYMRKFVADTKSKQAIPIVLSPVPRNIWQDGKVERVASSYGGWAQSVAQAEGAFFIDLNEIVVEKYETLGETFVGSTFFVTDHTHTNRGGASVNADLLVDAIRSLRGCGLRKFLMSSR